jgi:sulfoxide reductase heme-binding subunit YedZ
MALSHINARIRRLPEWSVYAAGMVPVPVLLYLAQTGGLGREPIKALEHELGKIALQLFVAVLAVTPLRRHVGLNLLKFRRALGLLCFFYVGLHLLVWLVLDVGIVAQIWADIIKRPYITIGMAAFALMIPLALTSNNWSLRRLGPRWNRLHRLTYVAAVLGSVHYLMLVKTIGVEPFASLAVILGLLALRVPRLLPKQATSP